MSEQAQKYVLALTRAPESGKLEQLKRIELELTDAALQALSERIMPRLPEFAEWFADDGRKDDFEWLNAEAEDERPPR